MEVDFKGLLRFSDLNYFSGILTEQDKKQCNSRKSTDSLSSEIIKCFRNKRLDLLAKIPECLRAAGNDSLAAELEGAYQALHPRAGTPGIPVRAPVQETDDEGTRAFAGPGGGVYEFPYGSSPSSYKSDSFQGNF